MRHSTADTIIPTRFLVTTSHFLATIMVYITRDVYVRAALPLFDMTDYTKTESVLVTALSLSWACFIIQYFGLFAGYTTFNAHASTFYIISHFCATITLSYFITEGWHYVAFWYIFGFCNALPTIIELGLIMRVMLLNVNTY